MPMYVGGEIYRLCQVEHFEQVKDFRHMLISRATKMKIEITQNQQTTCNGIAVFQKCRHLFNKQRISKFIFPIRWRSVETEKVDRPFFQRYCCLKQFKRIMFKTKSGSKSNVLQYMGPGNDSKTTTSVCSRKRSGGIPNRSEVSYLCFIANTFQPSFQVSQDMGEILLPW